MQDVVNLLWNHIWFYKCFFQPYKYCTYILCQDLELIGLNTNCWPTLCLHKIKVLSRCWLLFKKVTNTRNPRLILTNTTNSITICTGAPGQAAQITAFFLCITSSIPISFCTYTCIILVCNRIKKISIIILSMEL